MDGWVRSRSNRMDGQRCSDEVELMLLFFAAGKASK